MTLGSLRVRQDQLIVNSLGSGTQRNCACCGIGGIPEESTLAAISSGTTALEVALARIRQLSAHEVGHTIGFAHNFAASTYADRASVMDYPAPKVNIADTGELDFSDAYGVGIGEWDKVSVQYAYTEFEKDEEADGLDQILSQAKTKGYLYLSDADARPAGASHPLANLWDNGTDPISEWNHILKVREIALSQFQPSQLPADTTTADVSQYLTPLYLYHRFQVQAVAKLIGGNHYRYGYATNDSVNAPVDEKTEFKAVACLFQSLEPSFLQVPMN